MKSNRLKNAMLNSSILATIQIVTVLLRFANQTIFIRVLGKQFLGLNGLFTNVLSFLAFAELGVGTSIVFSLYSPLANDNKKNIAALMNFIQKAYRYIGMTVGILGLATIPLLPYFIKDYHDVDHIVLYYVLYLANSVISYFFTYKRSILIADQHEYISSINQFIFLVVQTILQIIFMFVVPNYAVYLIIAVFCTLFSNILISRAVDKRYPYLKMYQEERITSAEGLTIRNNVVGMVGSKIGSIVVRSTDNILLSAFLGLSIVGIYSNYLLIVTSVSGVINKLLSSVTASVGNLIVAGDRDRSFFVYKTHYLLNLFIVTISAVCFAVSFNPFIKVWAGKSYLLPISVVIVIVINYFIDQLRQTNITFTSAYGLFVPNGKKSVLEAILNLSFSYTLLVFFKLGISGVLLGTIITNIILNSWWEPWLIYKRGFKFQSSFIRFYFVFYLKHTILLFLLGSFTYVVILWLDNYIYINGFLLAIVNSSLSVLILSSLISLIYRKHASFIYITNVIKKLLRVK